MADHTRSQDFKKLEEAVRKNVEHTTQHAEILEEIQQSLEGITQLMTTLNSKYDGLAEKVSLTPSSSTGPGLLPNPHVNCRGFQPK